MSQVQNEGLVKDAIRLADAPFPFALYQWKPEEGQSVSGVIHILHGMAEYGLRYTRFAQVLNNAGWIVYTHDQPGHGPEIAKQNQLGNWPPDWFNLLMPQLAQLHQYLKQKHTGKPLVLMGHSMGSFIGQRYVQLNSSLVDGLILSATTGKKDPLLPFGIALAWLQKKTLGANHKSLLIDKLSFQAYNKQFKPNRTTHDWLSRNETEVDRYIADPLCGFLLSAGFMFDFFCGLRAVFNANYIQNIRKDLPVYGYAGSKDPVGLSGKGFLEWVQNWKNAGIRNLQYKLYEGGRHEMLNEINRQEVEEDLLSWLAKIYLPGA